MKIEKGWRFCTADFSIQADQEAMQSQGTVTLVRAPEEKKDWHALPDEIKESEDCPELYVNGQGFSLESAILHANLRAAQAKPIPWRRKDEK